MYVVVFIVGFIASVTVASLAILFFVRKEIAETRRQVISLYAELRQSLSEQSFQIEILKRSTKKRTLTLGELLEEPWVKELLEKEE